MVVLTGSLALTFLLGACGPAAGVGTTITPTIQDQGIATTMPWVPLDIAFGDLVVGPGAAPGEAVLTFTVPGETGQKPPDAYVVRASNRHITEATLADATLVSVAEAPGPPGSVETLTVRGLDPDRTMQFSVQTVTGGTTSPLGYAAAGRTAGRDVPPPPAGAIHLAGPATLSKDGATYLLTRDITTAGTAFRIKGHDVTLDLGGHTAIFGTGPGASYGVLALSPVGGTSIVRNGRLVQGGSGSESCGIHLYETGGTRISYVEVEVSGPDTSGIWIANVEGDVRVDHCRVACRTQVVENRHYPGVTALLVDHATGTVEVDHNDVTASPQWGIRVNGEEHTGTTLVHHNRVLGTKALVANGYMLGLHRPRIDAYENVLRGESRGIHVDAIDGDGTDAWIHDNEIQVQDQPNPEYPDRHWAHGIKIEGASGCLVEHNRVSGTADASHGDVFALDLTVGDAKRIVVRSNFFEAISLTPDLEGQALRWTYGATTAPNDAIVHQNVFRATDYLVYHYWSAGVGGTCRDNWHVRDLSQGASHPLVFEYFGNADDRVSRGTRILDAYPSHHVLDVENWHGSAPFDSSREWTLRVAVVSGTTPVTGASVAVRNRAGVPVLVLTTDGEGRAEGTVLGTLVTNGPTYTHAGPHTITVQKPGASMWTGSVVLDRPRALVVDLAAGKGTPDTEAPTRPTSLAVSVPSASRALLLWDASTDDLGPVKSYLIALDGKPAAITRERGVFLGGLSAATTYIATVRSLDVAGNVSAWSEAVSFTTRPEDRGP